MIPVPRRTTTAGLLAGAALVLGSCSGAGPAGTSQDGGAAHDLTPLTIGLTYTPDVQFAPFYLAESSGAFERAGLDVTLRHHGANESLFGALNSGEEDVVYAGGDEMMQARTQGVDVVNVATLYQDYPVALIVPQDSPITTAADLAGTSIGVPGPYGETYFGLLSLLDEQGLSEADVDVQYIGYTQQSALQSGAVDAIMGFSNNDAVQLEQAGVPVRTLTLGEPASIPLVGAGLGAPSTLVQEDPKALAAVVEALREVMSQQGKDTGAVLEAAATQVPGLLDPAAKEKAAATWEATLPLYGDPAHLGQQDAERWQRMSAFLAQAGLVDGAVPANEAMTTSVLDLLAH